MPTERQIGKGTKIYPLAQIAEDGVWIGTKCKISTKSKIGKCHIGHGCIIGFNSDIQDGSWLGNGVIVENNVTVYGVKIGNYCLLERWCEIHKDLGNYVKVGAFSKW